MIDKNIKRFRSVDKIYSTYERTKNFRKIFGVTRKGKVGGLEPGKKNDKTDSIMRVIQTFIPEKEYGKIQIRKTLKKLGYEAVPEVGVAGYFIDIGIKHPSYKYGYLAGIECDGRAYHSSLSARDNDIIRQKVLEGLGWNIYRIWSTDWYQDPNKELKILDNYLKLKLRKKLS